MSEPEDFHPEDDFAALFEASTGASSFTKGQSIEGTIVGKALYAGAFTLPEALEVAGWA